MLLTEREVCTGIARVHFSRANGLSRFGEVYILPYGPSARSINDLLYGEINKTAI